jgi:hypothetical protein
MFFIFGISSGEKKLNFVQTMVCSRCGQFGRLEVFMTYQYFSLFFIPIFRWGLRFFVKSTCCGTVYQLETSMGKRILKGEPITLTEEDLTMVKTGWSQSWKDYGQYDNQRYGDQSRYGQDPAKSQYGPDSADMEHGSEPTAGQAAKRCESCGYTAAPDFVYCPKCGKPL